MTSLSLIVFRVLQGFAGGVLIPLVFAAIFLLFGKGLKQTIATTIGGLLAVLAPTLGPLTGGWITESYTWHWLFLINVVPGIVTLVIGILCLPQNETRLSLFKTLDWISLVYVAVGLAALLIGLKEAPDQGWLAPQVSGCFLIFADCRVSRHTPADIGHFLLAAARPQPGLWLHSQFHPGHWPVWFGLPAAAVPCLRAWHGPARRSALSFW